MKYALFENHKIEATKGARGLCPGCREELIAKCGEIKINHWAHKGIRSCDQWWENETDWHRSWKGNFPIEWQEEIHFDSNGEKHIADVKTQEDWVLEFQYSFLNPEERHARNLFYKKLVWVVNGLRRKKDLQQFQSMLDGSVVISQKPQIRRIRFPDECRLIKEWGQSNSLVFFDFQKENASTESMLWFLFPVVSGNCVFVAPFDREKFVSFHTQNGFDKFMKDVILPYCQVLSGNHQIGSRNSLRISTRDLHGFRQLMMHKRRGRRRL